MKKKPKRNFSTSKAQATNTKVSITTLVFLLLSLFLTCVIVLKGIEYNRRLFTWSFIALFLGLLFESYFIFKNLNSILNRFSISFFISLITFLPGKRERIYNIQSHIELWPYFFLVIFIVGIILIKQKELITKQTEGTTLLQSLVIFYWLFDNHFFSNIDFFRIILLIFIITATTFSIINALTKIDLGRANRLFLSIWSSIMLMCLAVDNVIRVFRNGDIDQQSTLLLSVEVTFQYFFVGISSVYVVQNIFMLLAFLPEKNIKYKQTLFAAKKMHIDRYSDKQVSLLNSLFCICFCFFFFFLNRMYSILPTHTIIWFVIITFPAAVYILSKARQKIQNS